MYKFLLSFGIDIQRDIITILFEELGSEYQWIFAFILPLIRELNILLLNKILKKMASMDDV